MPQGRGNGFLCGLIGIGHHIEGRGLFPDLQPGELPEARHDFRCGGVTKDVSDQKGVFMTERHDRRMLPRSGQRQCGGQVFSTMGRARMRACQAAIFGPARPAGTVPGLRLSMRPSMAALG